MAENNKQIMFRGSEDYKEMLKIAAAKRRIDVQELIYRAIEQYLATPENGTNKANSDGEAENLNVTSRTVSNGGTRSGVAYSSRNTVWHDYLEEILESGIDSFIRGIIANLECWGEVARFARSVDEQTSGDTKTAAEQLRAVWSGRASRAKEYAARTEQGNRKERKATTKRPAVGG
jgi:hypothetical protein